MSDIQKAIWVLQGFTEALEADLARRVGEHEAAMYCMGLHMSLTELNELRKKLDRLDSLELDAPGHRRFQPFPEI